MQRRKQDPKTLTRLIWAQNELRRIRTVITPKVARRVNARVRSLLKSVDGAIRHTERMDKSRA